MSKPLDLSRYEGHATGPWWEDDDRCIANGSGDDYITLAQVFVANQATVNLIADAPALLGEVIRLRELVFRLEG